MKSIIERQATFENNSDMEVKVTQIKIITSICKGNTMKQKMLKSLIHLTSQAPRGSLPSKYVSMRNICVSNS